MRSLPRYHNRTLICLRIVLSLGAAYLLTVRAIDTGSLQQYGLAVILLFIAGVSVPPLFRKDT